MARRPQLPVIAQQSAPLGIQPSPAARPVENTRSTTRYEGGAEFYVRPRPEVLERISARAAAQ